LEERDVTYTPGALLAHESYPSNITPRHRTELEKARAYLESIAGRHPEWIVRKARG